MKRERRSKESEAGLGDCTQGASHLPCRGEVPPSHAHCIAQSLSARRVLQVPQLRWQAVPWHVVANVPRPFSGWLFLSDTHMGSRPLLLVAALVPTAVPRPVYLRLVWWLPHPGSSSDARERGSEDAAKEGGVLVS